MTPIQRDARKICRRLNIDETLKVDVTILDILTDHEIKNARDIETKKVVGAKSIPHKIIRVSQWACYRKMAALEMEAK